MKMVYTICSANHLAFAKTMADTFVLHNPDYHVVIGLADKINNRFDVSYFKPYQVIELETLGIPEFDQMVAQYSVIEFNCALKPYLARHLFQTYNPHILFYLDTDICIYSPLTVIEEALLAADILVTPHFTTPINDGFHQMERGIINAGLYNAGFVGMKKSERADRFLNWWADRLKDQCYYNYAEGMGVDQTWLNFVPLFFETANVFNHKGANVAYWNLHERKLSEAGNNVMVNDSIPLLFLHISGYNFAEPGVLSKHQNRYFLQDLPLLQKLFANYREKVMANNYELFFGMEWFYGKPKKLKRKRIKKLLKKIGLFGKD